MTNQPESSRPALFSNFRLLAFAPALLCALAMITVQSAQAQTLNVLHSFTGIGDVAGPYGVTFDSAGNLYGTTFYSNGGVYELMRRDSSWILEPLYSFQGGSGGRAPEGGVVFGPDDALYGTTFYGGQSGSICANGLYDCGTVYSVQPSPHSCGNALCPWNWTPVYLFGGGSSGLYYGGVQPESGVVFDSAGNIYGTTVYGGPDNYGTAFQLSRTQNGWSENTIYNFSTYGGPSSGFSLDAAGNLYGSFSDPHTNGFIYELVHTGQGWNQQTIYAFQGGNDGTNPHSSLIFDAAGNAYGTTQGYAEGFPGTVYRLSPQPDGTWQETVLYVFDPYIYGPVTNLAMDAAGNLYGSTPGTAGDGGDPFGMVFELSPVNGSWIFTQLHHFTGGADGGFASGVTLDSAGNVYGTCSTGGVYEYGTIWEITP